MKVYVLEYKANGNTWRIKTIASSVIEAKRNVQSAMYVFPLSRIKNIPSLTQELHHNTFGAERVK